jgi:hypothetical protein
MRWIRFTRQGSIARASASQGERKPVVSAADLALRFRQ